MSLETPVYVRGDYHVCPTPLALDPYYGCLQRCTFCFCREIEHRFNPKGYAAYEVRDANLKKAENLIKLGLSEKETTNHVALAIRAGWPMALGKKGEPFQPVELERGMTLKCLRLLKEYDLPTLVETKHIYLGLDKYLKIIGDMNKVAINVSIISGSMSKVLLLEPHAPLTDHRWKLIKLLKDSGFWVGVRNEPLLMGIGSGPKTLERYANKAAEAGVDHVNFGNYRAFDPKMAYANFEASGLGKEYLRMLRLNEKWRETGEYFVKLLHDRGIKATSSDWDTFHDLNDCENCCGIDDVFPDFNRFTFQHALMTLREEGQVGWGSIAQGSGWLQDDKVLKIKNIWNMEDRKYYSLNDAHGVGVTGRDGEGNVIYGPRVMKSLAEVFG